MTAGRDCPHGQLARSCETCLYESEIGDLEVERDKLREALRKGWNLRQYEWAEAHPDEIAAAVQDGQP